MVIKNLFFHVRVLCIDNTSLSIQTKHSTHKRYKYKIVLNYSLSKMSSHRGYYSTHLFMGIDRCSLICSDPFNVFFKRSSNQNAPQDRFKPDQGPCADSSCSPEENENNVSTARIKTAKKHGSACQITSHQFCMDTKNKRRKQK